jgi:hypothetical protein
MLHFAVCFAGMRIEEIQGPVDDGLLRNICDLYGSHVDPRYRDVEFVRTIFNHNPAGFSYHVFAFDGDRAVGCYAVIPFSLISRGRLIRGGKAEVLFLHEEYRRRRPQPGIAGFGGIALMSQCHQFAKSDGIELLFSLPGADVGLILKANGFKQLQADLNHSHFLLNARGIRQLNSNKWKVTAAQGLSIVQRGLCAGMSLASQVAGGASVEINRPDFIDCQLRTFARTRVTPEEAWSAALTEASLRWWLAFRYIRILTINGDPQQFVLVTCGGTGGNVEILDWRVRECAAGVAVLAAIIHDAEKQGALAVSFDCGLGEASSLGTVAQLLGFVRRRLSRSIYIAASDPFFHDPAALKFNWLFTI